MWRNPRMIYVAFSLILSLFGLVLLRGARDSLSIYSSLHHKMGLRPGN
jgi:hypothetical protein